MKLLTVVLVALALAGAAPAQDQATAPPPIALKHRELVRRLRTHVRDGSITYTDDRVVLRGHVEVWPASFAVHVEASFHRVAGRVHLHVEELRVKGKRKPNWRDKAEALIEPLVDVESESTRVLVQEGELEHGFDVAP